MLIFFDFMKVIKSQHDIRRTFATDLFDAGVNLKVIQKWMGHESATVTESYIKHRENSKNEFADIEKLCSKAVSSDNSEAINF